MEPNERERFTDALLDAALRQHGHVEPRAGLEQRVLAGVRAKENEATAPWWRWQWVAVAAAAALVMTLGIYLARPGENTVEPSEITVKPEALPKPNAAAESVANVVPDHRRVTARGTTRRARVVFAAAPAHHKLEVFPAPSSITEQERVALYYARRAPQEALLAAAAKVSQPLGPLEIEQIHVAPLAEPQGTQENPQDGIQK